MPNQCVHCGAMYPDGADAILKGCTCGSHFFYFIREQHVEQAKTITAKLTSKDKKEIEKDMKEIIGAEVPRGKAVILDLESVNVFKPGKYDIDLVKILGKRQPLIYRLEEGKYIIDLPSTFQLTHKKR